MKIYKPFNYGEMDMDVCFANVNVCNWNDLSEHDQEVVGEFFDKWFNKTDGLGIAPIHNNGNLDKNDPFFYTFFIKSAELHVLVPEAKMELDMFYTREDGTRVNLVFGCFEDKGMTSYLNRKE